MSIDHIISQDESSGKGTGAWLNFPREARHCFSDVEFCTAIRLRMHLPVIQSSTHQYCRRFSSTGTLCCQTVDKYGLHCLLCKIGGHVVRRHNAERDELARLLKEPSAVASGVLLEQNAPNTPTENMRPDIVFHDFHSRVRHIDVEVCTPYQGRSTQQYRPGALIEQLEAVKRRKYRHLPLIPGVFSHLGRLGVGITGLLKLVYRGQDEQQRSDSINLAYQSLACTLQQQNVALLSSSNTLIAST